MIETKNETPAPETAETTEIPKRTRTRKPVSDLPTAHAALVRAEKALETRRKNSIKAAEELKKAEETVSLAKSTVAQYYNKLKSAE